MIPFSRSGLAFLLFGLVLASVVLFVAGLWFLDFAVHDGVTTSFVPFAWGIDWSEGTALNVTYYVLVGAFVFGCACSFAFAWFLRGSFSR
jgi:hypothetical protein